MKRESHHQISILKHAGKSRQHKSQTLVPCCTSNGVSVPISWCLSAFKSFTVLKRWSAITSKTRCEPRMQCTSDINLDTLETKLVSFLCNRQGARFCKLLAPSLCDIKLKPIFYHHSSLKQTQLLFGRYMENFYYKNENIFINYYNNWNIIGYLVFHSYYISCSTVRDAE
jgi:hypothetical protein